MKPAAWIAIVFAVAVVAAIALSSFRAQPFRCRVCITFHGQTDCRTASAQDRMEALRTATVAACSQISGGVIESNQCEHTRPDSVEWLK